jgi:hypothetical protein
LVVGGIDSSHVAHCSAPRVPGLHVEPFEQAAHQESHEVLSLVMRRSEGALESGANITPLLASLQHLLPLDFVGYTQAQATLGKLVLLPPQHEEPCY